MKKIFTFVILMMVAMASSFAFTLSDALSAKENIVREAGAQYVSFCYLSIDVFEVADKMVPGLEDYRISYTFVSDSELKKTIGSGLYEASLPLFKISNYVFCYQMKYLDTSTVEEVLLVLWTGEEWAVAKYAPQAFFN